jgi:hypothetical protein
MGVVQEVFGVFLLQLENLLAVGNGCHQVELLVMCLHVHSRAEKGVYSLERLLLRR